jgi:predicted Holliday junction resolvase-like endonuclease
MIIGIILIAVLWLIMLGTIIVSLYTEIKSLHVDIAVLNRKLNDRDDYMSRMNIDKEVDARREAEFKATMMDKIATLEAR